jgi:type III restriction enzyme
MRVHLTLETKGYDPLAQVKALAAQRWVAAVNAEGQHGRWHYAVAIRPEEVRWHIKEIVTKMQEEGTAAAEIA